ncbi:MAG: DUF938 domain-containing protein [Gammaproteobacteria bacterium]|nr:DUF938 domain-containing protein [Gammaproteobacteria bacterium]
MMKLPFAEACEQNKQVIADVLRPYLQAGSEVLEVGSGTGQHAVFFAEQFPQSYWQTSDRLDCIEGLRARISSTAMANTPEPLVLDVCDNWPDYCFDMIFSSNTLHIMDESNAKSFLSCCNQCLKPDGHLIVYGAFNYNQEFTSESNRNFDNWLKARNPSSGIKDFEWVDQLANSAGLKLIHDIAMPANNRSLVWKLETFPPQ